MKLRLVALVPLVVVAVPGLAQAFWGWSDTPRPEVPQGYGAPNPNSAAPVRNQTQQQRFNRVRYRDGVTIDARWPEVPVFIKKANVAALYDLKIRAETPEFDGMSVIAYPAKTEPSADNRQLEMTCGIDSIRRWDRDRARGWGTRLAATFHDKQAVKLLDKAKTVLVAHGYCHPKIEKRGQLRINGAYEYHAAFVSQFEDTDKTGVMMEIGTGLRLNSGGNGYFEAPRVQLAFTAVHDRDEALVRLK